MFSSIYSPTIKWRRLTQLLSKMFKTSTVSKYLLCVRSCVLVRGWVLESASERACTRVRVWDVVCTCRCAHACVCRWVRVHFWQSMIGIRFVKLDLIRSKPDYYRRDTNRTRLYYRHLGAANNRQSAFQIKWMLIIVMLSIVSTDAIFRMSRLSSIV